MNTQRTLMSRTIDAPFFPTDSQCGAHFSPILTAFTRRKKNLPFFLAKTRVAINGRRSSNPLSALSVRKKSVVVSLDNLWETFCILDFTWLSLLLGIFFLLLLSCPVYPPPQHDALFFSNPPVSVAQFAWISILSNKPLRIDVGSMTVLYWNSSVFGIK